ncbi:MAG: hypothetical protein K2Y01_10345 [Rhabdochlamydiaceae bacterium]|nr:hypothetical protein [Rhabdochlamydiaceae bacterium]
MMESQIAAHWAQVFAPFLFLVGLSMLLYRDNFVKIMASLKSSPACFYMLGLLNLLIGLILITQCNVWEMNKIILITLLGWFLTLRGVVSLFCPGLLMKFLGKGKLTKLLGIIPLAWGILLYWAILA